jgi:hypothetical protein
VCVLLVVIAFVLILTLTATSICIPILCCTYAHYYRIESIKYVIVYYLYIDIKFYLGFIYLSIYITIRTYINVCTYIQSTAQELGPLESRKVS